MNTVAFIPYPLLALESMPFIYDPSKKETLEKGTKKATEQKIITLKKTAIATAVYFLISYMNVKTEYQTALLVGASLWVPDYARLGVSIHLFTQGFKELMHAHKVNHIMPHLLKNIGLVAGAWFSLTSAGFSLRQACLP